MRQWIAYGLKWAPLGTVLVLVAALGPADSYGQRGEYQDEYQPQDLSGYQDAYSDERQAQYQDEYQRRERDSQERYTGGYRGESPQRRDRAALEVTLRSDPQRGLQVRDVDPASVAARAGLQEGDRIIAFEVIRDGRRGVIRVEGEVSGARQRDQRTERTRRAALGVRLGEGRRGVEITDVEPGTPAEEAGLRPGDEILAIDGQQVQWPDEVVRLIGRGDPRDRVSLQILRDGRRRTVQTTLERHSEVFDESGQARRQEERRMARPDAREMRSMRERQRPEVMRGMRGEPTGRAGRQGALGVELDESRRGTVEIAEIYPDSPAEEAGLRPGDQIVAVNGREVSSADEVTELIGRSRPNQQIELTIQRGGRERTLVATLASQQEVFAERGDAREAYSRDEIGREQERLGERVGERVRQGAGNLGERIFGDDL